MEPGDLLKCVDGKGELNEGDLYVLHGYQPDEPGRPGLVDVVDEDGAFLDGYFARRFVLERKARDRMGDPGVIMTVIGPMEHGSARLLVRDVVHAKRAAIDHVQWRGHTIPLSLGRYLIGLLSRMEILPEGEAPKWLSVDG